METKKENQPENEELIIPITATPETGDCPLPLQATLNWWRRLLIGLGLLCGVLLISLLTVTIVWREARLQTLLQKEHHLCVHCDEEMRQTYSTDEGFSAEVKDENTTMCCPKASSAFDMLIKMKTIENYQSTSASRLLSMYMEDCDNTTKPNIRISGIAEKDMQSATSQSGLIHWKWNGSLTNEDFHYYNGRLSVKTPGYYYIVSHIRLQTNQPIEVTDTPDSPDHVSTPAHTVHSHSIHIHNTVAETEIMYLENSKSMSDPLRDGETSSSVGAVFKLHENNTVHVKTSHPGHLLMSDNNNAFEFYMV